MDKKSKKKRYILISIIALLIIATVIYLIVRPKGTSYTEETVKTQDLTTYYSFTGNIEAKDTQKVIAMSTTKITKVYVEEGDKVKVGTDLFQTVQGQIIEAEIAGQVAEVLVSKDSTVAAGTVLARITDYNNLQVTIKVDEYDVGAVKVGKEVSIYVNSLNKTFKGNVSKVSKEATTVNNVSYFTAVVDIQKDSSLLVGMSTEIKMVNKSAAGAITISIKSLQFDNQNTPYVYIKKDGKIVSQEVKVGINDGTTVQILEGLNSGDTVYLPVTKTSLTTVPSNRLNSIK